MAAAQLFQSMSENGAAPAYEMKQRRKSDEAAAS